MLAFDSLTDLQRGITKKWLLCLSQKVVVQAKYCSSDGGHPVGFITMLFEHVLKISDDLKKKRRMLPYFMKFFKKHKLVKKWKILFVCTYFIILFLYDN